jgi:exosome complex component RRP43
VIDSPRRRMVKALAAETVADCSDSRHDGRQNLDFRDPVVLCDLLGSCQGSASARLGSTFVLAGVRAVQEVPARTVPDAGELQVKVCHLATEGTTQVLLTQDLDEIVPFVQAEVTSLAAANRRGIDIRALSHTLTHQLQEQLCTTSFLDPKSLCLQPGKHCWHILVDVQVLNDDGGLLAACLLAASFALASVQARTTPFSPLIGTLAHAYYLSSHVRSGGHAYLACRCQTCMSILSAKH